MEEIRVAVVGYGLAGSVFHVPLLRATDGMRVTSVVTANPERQRQVHAHCPGSIVFERVEQLWRHAGDHDLVVVATPTSSHVPLASRALELGLPVVVDKPLAADADAAQCLVDLAEKQGVPLTVFQNRRWDADQLTLRRLLADGVLGEVVRYESRFERWQPAVRPDRWRDITPPEGGGGALLDLGSHVVDQALALFGPAEVAYADVRAVRGGVSDDVGFVVLRHENGVESHLSFGALFGAPGPRLRVLGTGGAFVVEHVDGQEDQLRAGVRPGLAAYGVQTEETWGWFGQGETWQSVSAERGAWPEFYAGVARAIRDGGPMPVDPRDAVATQRLLDTARRIAMTPVEAPE